MITTRFGVLYCDADICSPWTNPDYHHLVLSQKLLEHLRDTSRSVVLFDASIRCCVRFVVPSGIFAHYGTVYIYALFDLCITM